MHTALLLLIVPLLDEPVADITIASPYGDSEIVVRTETRFAGAISSVTWNGQEFIDQRDHGRELQSASNFDAGSKFSSETFNPTEAGSRYDGDRATTTSRLLHSVHGDNWLQTTSQMAFWLRPGERSGGAPAKNRSPLSNHLLTKRVTIGYAEFPNVIEHVVTFHVPLGEQHSYAQFEAVTGYMPEKFHAFFRFDHEQDQLVTLDEGPGEQRDPVVLSTDDGRFAMGVFSPDQPSPGFENAGYGRFRFAAQTVNKWNCVFRIRDNEIAAGDYTYRNLIILGSKADVERTMQRLTAMPGRSAGQHSQ